MTPPSHDGAVVFDHIAIAVPRIAAAPPFLVGELGGRRLEAGPGIGFRWWQWTFARGGTIEVLEPDGPAGGFLHRFLERRGPGIHHVTFKVSSLDEAVGHAASLGYEVVGFNDEWPDWKEAFLHPRQAHGIVVQLAESNPALAPEDGGEWPFPDEPAQRPEPVDLLGLRLVAASAERVRQLWEEMLRGRCSASGSELVFRWPDSPLRIAVTIDAGAAEGPRGIELAPRSGLALPEGPHPALGTAFLAAR